MSQFVLNILLKFWSEFLVQIFIFNFTYPKLIFLKQSGLRLITSKGILINVTFTYTKDFYQNIIILFYNPICFKMIHGILFP